MAKVGYINLNSNNPKDAPLIQKLNALAEDQGRSVHNLVRNMLDKAANSSLSQLSDQRLKVLGIDTSVIQSVKQAG